jgi:hypothetical protein
MILSMASNPSLDLVQFIDKNQEQFQVFFRLMKKGLVKKTHYNPFMFQESSITQAGYNSATFQFHTKTKKISIYSEEFSIDLKMVDFVKFLIP